MIDLYCERIGPGLLAEPLNASTNGFFMIAAWWCWHSARKSARRDVMVLAGTMFAIGIGSGLFHTFALPWAKLLDVIPLSLGVETVGGAVAKLIVRNSPVPARATEMFSTRS